MDDRFNIYIDRLEIDEDKIFDESFSPEFMDIQEAELDFKKPIRVKGKAYLTNESVVLNLVIEAEAIMPCAVCNEDVLVNIVIKDFSHIEPFTGIRGGIFNFKDILRETILLELPLTAECNNGSCKEREFMAKYMAKNKPDEKHPFSEL